MFNIKLPWGGNMCLNNITEQIMKFKREIQHNKTFPLITDSSDILDFPDFTNENYSYSSNYYD